MSYPDETGNGEEAPVLSLEVIERAFTAGETVSLRISKGRDRSPASIKSRRKHST